MKRTLYTFSIVALLLAVTCLAGADKPGHVAAKATDSGDLPATLTGPTEVMVGQFANYGLEIDATRVSWKCISSTGLDPNFFALQAYQGMGPEGKPRISHIAFFSTLRPGMYYITIAAVKENQLAHLILPIKVIGTGPEPDPGPDPKPDPTPPPVPGTKIALVMHETGEATATTGQVLQGLRMWFKANLPDGRWRIEDQNLPAKLVQQSLSRAKTANLTLPCLGVATVSDAGEVVAFEGTALPATSAQAIAWVKGRVGQ
jgi:hypothetical protein